MGVQQQLCCSAGHTWNLPPAAIPIKALCVTAGCLLRPLQLLLQLLHAVHLHCCIASVPLSVILIGVL